MGKESASKESSINPTEPSITDSKPQSNQPKQISLGEFLANSKELAVRKASDYIYVGFRKHCQLNKVPYRKSESEWLAEFQKFINKAGN